MFFYGRKFVDRTTSPAPAGTAIPRASLEEIAITRLDRKVITKADHAAKRKASTGSEISTNEAKKTRSSTKGSRAGSSGQSVGDGVEQVNDGTFDDDDQRDDTKFAMEGMEGIDNVSQGEHINVIPLRTFDLIIGLDVIYPPILLPDKEVEPDIEHSGGEDVSPHAQEAAPTPNAQSLDFDADADEIASDGNVDPYYEDRAGNIAWDVLESYLLPLILGPYYIFYPYDEVSGSESPPYIKDDWEEIHGVNLCMTRSSIKELFLPLENPEQKFRSRKRLFETPSLVESNSPKFDQFSDIEEGDYWSGVTRPKINQDAHFELKRQFLKELRDNTFSGSEHEDANERIEKVLDIVDLFHISNITRDQIMLRAFHVSLTRAATRWLRNQPSGFYQRNNGDSSYPDRRPCMEESMSKFMAESAKRHEENSNIIKEIRASTDAAIRNQGASIKTLELQIRQMRKVLQERGFGSFTIIDGDDVTRDVVLGMTFCKKYVSCQMIMKKFAHGDKCERIKDE
ncbi:hypothetical protein Tco_0678683 [Tanacetum coccineum]|uniref:Uncharacterized protein n=1 Tax=Tanacetum coccineum TaxID=301880 RepID=A0ABQ4XFR5_9ASTR